MRDLLKFKFLRFQAPIKYNNDLYNKKVNLVPNKLGNVAVILDERAPFFNFILNFSENLMLSNYTLFRLPLSTYFTHEILNVMIKDLDLFHLVDFVRISPHDLNLLTHSSSINSFIYKGSLTEASHLGQLAGKSLKNCYFDLKKEDIILVTESGDLDLLNAQLQKFASSSLEKKGSRSIRVILHKNQMKAFKRELNSIKKIVFSKKLINKMTVIVLALSQANLDIWILSMNSILMNISYLKNI